MQTRKQYNLMGITILFCFVLLFSMIFFEASPLLFKAGLIIFMAAGFAGIYWSVPFSKREEKQ